MSARTGVASAASASQATEASAVSSTSAQTQETSATEETSTAEETSSVEKTSAVYDTSAQYAATALSEGDELVGGTYTSTGKNGCPAVYSTADITVKNAALTSMNSRAVIIEGKNSVTLENCEVSGNDQSTKEGSVKANILLYQSMSGDASVGTSSFTMTGGSLTTESGAMIYCTNTDSVVTLTAVDLIYAQGDNGDGSRCHLVR